MEGYAAARRVARFRGVPVALMELPVRGGRVGAAAVAERLVEGRARELTRHLLRRWLARPAGTPAPAWAEVAAGTAVAALAAVPDPPEPALPEATVAVCTRDRPDDLARCLAALAALDYPHFSVLVVDNAPATNATEQLVRERFPGVRYAREPRPGLDWARDRAIAESAGEVLAFTDDDVVADRGWLQAVGRVFAESPAVMAVSGLIEPAELETRAQRDFEAYGGFGHGWARRWLYRPRRAGRPDFWHHGGGWLGTGANMAFRRALFDETGGFDPALDVGTATQGGGDLEMFFRVVQEGHVLVYAPEALVRHRHRRGDDELRRQLTTWGNGYHAYIQRSRRAYPEEAAAFTRLVRWWWGDYVSRDVLRAVRRGDRTPVLRRYEILGRLRNAGSYDQAARRAAQLLAQFPDEPAVLPRPSAPRAGDGVVAGRTVTHTVALDDALEAIEHLDAGAPADTRPVDAVRVTITARGQRVAEAAAVPEGGRVSAAQLRDAVAGALADRLLADPVTGDALRRSLAEWLARGRAPGI